MVMADFVLAVLALAVGVALAWRARPLARVVLFASAMLVSGLLFMPGKQIAALAGSDSVLALKQLAARTPWGASDWIHFLIFVWLGLLLWLARADLRNWKGWALVAGLAAAAEVAQVLASERESRLDDVLLNLVGGAAGLLLGMAIRHVRKRK